MLNFFAIVLIIFIGLLILIFKKRKFKNAINIKNLYHNKLARNRKENIQFLSNKNSFSYKHEEKNTQYFIKMLKEIKCLLSFKVIQKIN